MKTAHEVRAGNVIIINGEPMVVLKSEFANSLRKASTCKMKMKNLLTGTNMETIFKADDKFDTVILEKIAVTYTYFADPAYVFMDQEFNQYEINAEDMGEALNYLEDGMECEVVMYAEKPISIELPNVIVREVTYTEPAVRGDTSSSKITKNANISSGFTIQVPLFVDMGDKIEIDSRTNEYKSRTK